MGGFDSLHAMGAMEGFSDGFANRRVLLTGGTGFFGYWMLSLMAWMNVRGYGVRADVLTRDAAAFKRRAGRLATRGWLGVVEGDVRSWEFGGTADFGIHAATDTSASAHRDKLAIMDVISEGTKRSLGVFSSAGVSKSLFVSSGAVYGRFPSGIAAMGEDSGFFCNPLSPDGAYGVGKGAAEQYSARFGDASGMSIPTARCFAFMGPGLDVNGHFAFGNFVRDATAGGVIGVAGDGSPMRSYLYGADLAVWLFRILLSGRHATAYNVGSGDAVSIGDLAVEINDVLGGGGVDVRGGASDGPRSVYVPDVSRAKNELGLAAWTSRRDGALAMRDWLLKG